MRKKRALTSDAARSVRQKGHDDALAFALSIGLGNDYKNDHQAKKDVIDSSGDAHSVKSGEKKWQVFLYGIGRFKSDHAFSAMNGIGDILIRCITSFQPTFEEYQKDKISAKERLRTSMRELADKLQDKRRLSAFLNKSLFNGGEVKYLTVKQNNFFHVFLNTDVVEALIKNLEVCNSTARRPGEISEQKVLLRYEGVNLGEVEMRNDSQIHYREIRFNMLKPKVMKLLFTEITPKKEYNSKVFLYGKAIKKFCHR